MPIEISQATSAIALFALEEHLQKLTKELETTPKDSDGRTFQKFCVDAATQARDEMGRILNELGRYDSLPELNEGEMFELD